MPRRYNPALSLSREAVSRAVRLPGTLPMQGERSSSLQVEMAGFRFVIEADIWHYADVPTTMTGPNFFPASPAFVWRSPFAAL